MSKRKIRLSQKFTLSFRDVTLPDADAVAELLNDEPNQGSSDETFNSLPDLFPDIFDQSQTNSPAPDLTYSTGNYSTYKHWESCTTDAIPLASQSEGAKYWLKADTLSNSGAGSSVHFDDIQSDLQFHDSDSVTRATKIGFRENLRRVQAFAPHTSILDIEKDLELDILQVRENLRSAHADATCESLAEYDTQPNPLDVDDDTDICVDGYLLLEEDMTKDSPPEESILADETTECSRLSSIKEVPNSPQVAVGKHREVKKMESKRKPTYQDSNYYSLDFPKEFRKQKRSIPSRRGRPSTSINLMRKIKWLSDTGHDDLERNTQLNGNLTDEEANRTTKTRKPRRKTVSVATVTLLSSEPLARQSVELKPITRRRRQKLHSEHVLRSAKLKKTTESTTISTLHVQVAEHALALSASE